MAQPTSKTQFKEFCLRKLGKPVIEINVDDDQVDDRIDEALSYYQDYHFDGVEKTYVKHRVTNSSVTLSSLEEGDFEVGEVISEKDINSPFVNEANLTNVVATSTAGDFTCINTTLSVGYRIVVSGTITGDGDIAAGTYLVEAVSGQPGAVNAFTLTQLDGSPVGTHGTGATTGGTFTPQNNTGSLGDDTATATIIAIDSTNNKIFFKKPSSGTFNVGKFVTSPKLVATNGTNTSRTITATHQGTYELEYIPVPENIIGAINVFSPESNVSLGTGMFSAKYQYVLHNLHDINMGPLVNFQMSMQHLQLMEELLVGAVPMRFNRHTDRIMLDVDWNTLTAGNYIVIEAYQVVDPNTYADVWKDRFLQNYATAKIKYQWGSNLTKFNGMTLPGNVQFNGEQILNDAREEIQKLEEEMSNSYSLPSVDMIG